MFINKSIPTPRDLTVVNPPHDPRTQSTSPYNSPSDRTIKQFRNPSLPTLFLENNPVRFPEGDSFDPVFRPAAEKTDGTQGNNTIPVQPFLAGPWCSADFADAVSEPEERLVSVYHIGSRHMLQPQPAMGGLAGAGGRGKEKSFCPDRDSRAVHQPGVVFQHPGGNLPIDGQGLKIGFWIEKSRLSFQRRFTQRLFLLKADVLRRYLDPERKLRPVREIVPAKVKNLKQTKVTTTTVTMKWNSVKGAVYYKIQFSQDDGKTWIDTGVVSQTSVTMTSMTPGTKYQFRIVAMDGDMKVPSKASAVLKTQTLCSAPKITVLESTKPGIVHVKWNEVTGAKEYSVFWSADSKNWERIGTVDYTDVEITGFDNDEKAYIMVRAINAYGKSGKRSAVKSVIIQK